MECPTAASRTPLLRTGSLAPYVASPTLQLLCVSGTISEFIYDKYSLKIECVVKILDNDGFHTRETVDDDQTNAIVSINPLI